MSDERQVSDFDAALAWLSTFTDFEQKGADRLGRDSLDLGRMKRLIDRFDHPERAFDVLHIAGSKGKGSTAILAERILRKAGIRTGRFLSPHLEQVTERIAIDGRPITPDDFAAAAFSLRPIIEDLERRAPTDVPSFFESITLMAFRYFAGASVDVAVMEVGLGGRLDATNVVRPSACVITSIDLEHTRVLGDTLPAIASEKAGIIKPGVPIFSGVPHDSPEGRVIAERADELDAPLQSLGREIRIELREEFDDGCHVFDLSSRGLELTSIRVGAPGRHQADNAALALVATHQILGARGHDIATDAASIIASVGAPLPGRIEELSGPASWPPIVLLDSAHTPASMQALASVVARRFRHQERPGLLLAMLKDKDVEACLAPLLPLVGDVICTAVDSPRSMAADALGTLVADMISKSQRISVVDRDQWPELVTDGSRSGLIVSGSTYLAGEVRRYLHDRP